MHIHHILLLHLVPPTCQASLEASTSEREDLTQRLEASRAETSSLRTQLAAAQDTYERAQGLMEAQAGRWEAAEARYMQEIEELGEQVNMPKKPV